MSLTIDSNIEESPLGINIVKDIKRPPPMNGYNIKKSENDKVIETTGSKSFKEKKWLMAFSADINCG